MAIPLLGSAIFLLLIAALPFIIIIRAVKKRKNDEPLDHQKGQDVHYNNGDREVLFRADKNSSEEIEKDKF